MSAAHYSYRALAILGIGIALMGSVVAIPLAHAQKLTVLHKFAGRKDGEYPYAGLVRDSTGILYGMTSAGGTYGFGIVFTVNKTGKEQVLHSFGGARDGKTPYAGLIQDASGTFYGTTSQGGTFDQGTVFKMSKKGGVTVLCNFGGGFPARPLGAVAEDRNGNLFGVLELGGASDFGLVYMCKAGALTTLYSFTGGSTDGAYPYGGLTIDAKGNLYGVTYGGGSSGAGVVFEMTPNGGSWKEKVLHSFAAGTSDGCYPGATPASDKEGNLYGTTYGCGSFGYGTVWKLSRQGKETVLHSFAGGAADGEYPFAGVTPDANGNLYGDTTAGGKDGYGTIYELNNQGKLVLLHGLTESEGKTPSGSVVRDLKGNLFGTALYGGPQDLGTLWQLTP
jgi:uncharacterized repeat protein (TIGR03803 family)